MNPRIKIFEALKKSDQFDVVVIGGGASGIGAAVEACLRGYRTLLLEKHDFSKGTSSRSTKLIHGGVRYMAQGHLKLVREALKERGYLLRNAPHLVHDQPFIVPYYRWWEGIFYTIGLKFYDLLSGRFSLGKSVHMKRDAVLKKLPGISPKGLRGGVLYHDGQFDDSRLAVDLLHELFAHGGLALNYAEVMALEHENGRVSGIVFRDVAERAFGKVSGQDTGEGFIKDTGEVFIKDTEKEFIKGPEEGFSRDAQEEFIKYTEKESIKDTGKDFSKETLYESGSKNFVVKSKVVINATGIWVDEIMKMDRPGHKKMIRPSQGVHLVINKSFLPGDHALMIPKTSDGRVLFVVPWHGHLVVGTTDTPIDTGSEEPVALEEEIRFILETATVYLERPVRREDVLSVFAGLRPLAAPRDGSTKTREISRNHRVFVSDSKLITVIGGKWTTYRKMAEEMIDMATRHGLPGSSKSATRNFRILNSGKDGAANLSRKNRFSLYGDHAGEIAALIEKDSALGAAIHPELPYTWAEVEWICRKEMVVHLEDLMARRLRMLFLNARVSREVAVEVGERMASLLDWSDERTRYEIESFRRIAENYVL